MLKVQYNENLLVRDVVMDSENEDDDSFLDEGDESLETDGNFFIDVKSQKETKNPWKRTCKAIQCGCNKGYLFHNVYIMKMIKEINENLIYFQFFQLLLQNGDITLS